MNKRVMVVAAESVVVVLTLVVGWVVVLTQARNVGLGDSGTRWLTVCALIATAAAGLWFRAGWRRPSWRAAVGLALVALSPTVFFYPLNVCVMIAAIGEGAFWGYSLWRRSRAAVSQGATRAA